MTTAPSSTAGTGQMVQGRVVRDGPWNETPALPETAWLPVFTIGRPLYLDEWRAHLNAARDHFLAGPGAESEYVMHLNGDCLARRHVHDDDYLLIDPRRTPNDGDIVHALVASAGTSVTRPPSGEPAHVCKVYRRVGDGYTWLETADDRPTTRLHLFAVLGVMAGKIVPGPEDAG